MAGDIQLRQLEYLTALAREQHFGRAAAACHASQSSLSAALRALERQLGVTIVQRGRRFGGFTPEGQRVVGWAHRILAERAALRSDLDRMRDGLSATVRIGAIPTAVPAGPRLTEALTARYPAARIRFEVLSSREIIHKLAEFELDAGLTYLDGDEIMPGTLRLYRERYLLLAPEQAFRGRDDVGWSDVASRPVCALTRSMQNRRIIDDAMAAQGLSMDVVVETDTVAALYAHVSTGRWSAVIANTWLAAFGNPAGMRALPIRDAGPRPWVGLIVGRQGPTSHVAQSLMDAIAGTDAFPEPDRGVACDAPRDHPVGAGDAARW
ncbi:LysR family transcriptional regulator [Pseudonocardia endophytica]|uniref:DNA-binding transcriptional LysR family regulator n=1 Tax=Pseudonocardia endophytica TaxID=401976 RepID=A0A4V2PHM8_PSEEN|nr:LysR family transcriptional regulator [Pseudonocardia endophytica]TCK21346.1 DNA-binding transcriptional LysR family regulator [Pseudonocardia endophytica]